MSNQAPQMVSRCCIFIFQRGLYVTANAVRICSLSRLQTTQLGVQTGKRQGGCVVNSKRPKTYSLPCQDTKFQILTLTFGPPSNHPLFTHAPSVSTSISKPRHLPGVNQRWLACWQPQAYRRRLEVQSNWLQCLWPSYSWRWSFNRKAQLRTCNAG